MTALELAKPKLSIEQKDFVESLVRNCAVPIFVVNAEHRVLIWNRACEELTGVKAEAMLGKDEPWKAFYDHKRPVLADIVIDGDVEHAPDYYSTIGKSPLIPEGLQAEGWYPDLNGMARYIFFNAAPIRNSRRELVAVIETLEDITERKRYEEQLEYMANHDALTNLSNRNLLADRLRQALLSARRGNRQLAVFFIDLDNFKLVNDSQGHETGDLLLKIVAERLTGCMREGDTLARVTMENLLRRALEKNELMLHYQPKLNLLTGRISGMEALLRWQSPELGMVSPVDFIPLAEETGLIEPIGEWVIRTACAQNKAWQDDGLPPLAVAVNLSPRQFRQKNLCGVIARVLRETGLAPRFLEFEVTESMVMNNVDWAIATLKELKGMGIHLSMDDFGTGYSSLSYLKRFPFDKLKIDRSFIRDITSDPDSAAIARAIIAMAHSLHLKVIAEGVETEGQLNYLLFNECDEMQGYYFSRPVPAADFGEMLRYGRQLQRSAGHRRGMERALLIVDDEEEAAAALAEVLAIDGYHILTATGAAAGFELLANHRVAVVLSDQRMPGMNGSEFLGRVRELYPDTVRIILSGHADLDSVTDAINRGAIYKFMCKPWKEEDIRGKIGDAFKHYESQRGKRELVLRDYHDQAARSGHSGSSPGNPAHYGLE